jgi:hypothetical protein
MDIVKGITPDFDCETLGFTLSLEAVTFRVMIRESTRKASQHVMMNCGRVVAKPDKWNCQL